MFNTLAPALATGVVAALLSFFSTLALVISALNQLGADTGNIASSITASCAGIALLGVTLTWLWRMPILVSWSVPGAALLAASSSVLPHFTLAIGGFLASAGLMLCIATWPALTLYIERLPATICAALLAGLLFPFALGAVQSFEHSVLFGGAALGAYLIGRRIAPAYAVIFVSLGVILVFFLIPPEPKGAPTIFAAGLEWQWPRFSLMLLVGISLPLCIVSLVAQNLPGLALLRQQGYEPSVRSVLWFTGAASLLLAPLGVFGLNLAPISAALCSSPESDGADVRRKRASYAYAATYAVLAFCSAPLLQAFNSLPKAAVLAVTGFALLVPLGKSLEKMLSNHREKEAAIITFLTGASGFTAMGMGSSFWGLVMGLLAMVVIAAR